MISIDGISYSALRRHLHKAPHLKQLLQRGFIRPMQTVFPSVTWAAHASIVTGQYPRNHGVIGNRWMEDMRTVIFPYSEDPADPYKMKRSYSLYDLAAQKKWPTAALNWPATQGANITYNWPELMYTTQLSYRYLSRPLKKIIQQKYKQAFGKKGGTKHLDGMFGHIATSDRIESDLLVRDLAVTLLKSEKTTPRLMLLHFLTPDTWLHRYGNSPWIEGWAIEQMDAMIGTIIKAYKQRGIFKRTAIFVFSDHGMLDIQYSVDLRLFLMQNKINKHRSMNQSQRRRARVMPFFNGHAAYLYIRPADQKAYIPRIIKLLQDEEIAQCIEGVYTPEEYSKWGLPLPPPNPTPKNSTPAQGIHPGAPTLLVLSKPHCIFTQWNRHRQVISPVNRQNADLRYGGHGYLPHLKPLQAFWLGSGAGIRTHQTTKKHTYKSLPPTDIVNIAPSMAHLLGLQWPRTWPNSKTKFRLDGYLLKDIVQP
jgi:hypothetical protein